MSRCPEFDALSIQMQEQFEGIAARFSQAGEHRFDGPAMYAAMKICLSYKMELPAMPPDLAHVAELLANEDTRELYLNGDIA